MYLYSKKTINNPITKQTFLTYRNLNKIHPKINTPILNLITNIKLTETRSYYRIKMPLKHDSIEFGGS